MGCGWMTPQVSLRKRFLGGATGIESNLCFGRHFLCIKGKNKSDFTKSLTEDQSRTKVVLSHLSLAQKPLLFMFKLGFEY